MKITGTEEDEECEKKEPMSRSWAENKRAVDKRNLRSDLGESSNRR